MEESCANKVAVDRLIELLNFTLGLQLRTSGKIRKRGTWNKDQVPNNLEGRTTLEWMEPSSGFLPVSSLVRNHLLRRSFAPTNTWFLSLMTNPVHRP